MNYNSVVGFFSHPFFSIYGGISVLMTISLSLYVVWVVVKGIMPVWYRLGLALTKRKIVIFATDDNFDNLRNVLVDSNLFKASNIKRIDQKSIASAGKESLLLMHWKSFENNLNAILNTKQDLAALIVYAPTEEGRIDENSMAEMGKHRNVIVVNFRGRLLNDVLVSMMTSRR